MTSFTKSPNGVVFNQALSFGARVAHTALLHLAWKAGRRDPDDAVALPPLDELARLVGCSRTAFKGYLAELRKERLVATRRIRNQGMLYLVFEVPATPDELGRNPTEPRAESGLSRAGAILAGEKTGNGAKAPSPPGHAPKLTLVEGQNLAFNALAELCHVDTRGNRGGLLGQALNSRGSRKGIRDLFWLEIESWAETEGRPEVLESRDGAWFEQALVRGIRRKAELYQQRLPGATLTPTALRDWWLDLEQTPTKGGMTTAEMIAYASSLDG